MKTGRSRQRVLRKGGPVCGRNALKHVVASETRFAQN